MRKRKNKFELKPWMGFAAGGFLVLMLMVFGTTANAEWNFWQGVKDSVASLIYKDIKGTQPDFSVPEELDFGAIPGDVWESNVVTIGGVEKAFLGKPLTATSVTLCVFKNPWNATATLDKFTFFANDPFTGGAETYDLSTSTHRYLGATTTTALIHNRTLSVTAGQAIWRPRYSTTTKSLAVDNAKELMNSITSDTDYFFLKPSEYIGIKIGTGTPGVETITGYCNAEFTRLYHR